MDGFTKPKLLENQEYIYIYIYYVFNCRIGESSNFQIKTDRHASWKFGFISCINDIL